jgi:RNA polymerase sigma factor (sigma-70 family)
VNATRVHDARSRTAELLLVRDAQAGDVAALGVLLDRYRSAMLAVALGVLGRPSDAEDAVQDAMLTALGRIQDLRDPGAVGPWLKMIVRNCCRMHVRANLPVPVADQLPGPRLAEAADPALLLEDHAARDWVWHAVEQLSEPLRVVTLLRYFTGVKTYEQIGAVCGIPVGTVRSRLSKARSALARQLCAGVPLVLRPVLADQPWNAQRVASAGVGLVTDDPAEAGPAVRTVLTEPRYRAAAQAAAAAIRSMPAPAAALASLLVKTGLSTQA